MNLGTLVLGLLNGFTIGLLAAGLVLVFKSNRFINLGHAQMGTLSSLLLAKWVLDWGWNWWAAFGLAVALGLATSVLIERFMVRPLRRRKTSATRLLFLTVGVSQLLMALTFIPSLGPDQTRSNALEYPQPFASHARVGHVVLTGMSLLTLFLVPVLVLSLAAFLRFSSLGKQIRAAASNADAARLCGVSVDRVSSVTWGLAGALAAVSAVLQAPTQPSFNVASFGPYLLMLTLGAAACGAFVSLPWALAGGLLLGVTAQLVAAETSDATKAELVVFVLILAIVLARGRALSRVFTDAAEAISELRVIEVPARLRDDVVVRHLPRLLAGCAIAFAAIIPFLPYFNSPGHRFFLVLTTIYALIGVALTILTGWAGQVSLGHFAIVGLAAYLTARWAQHGWSLLAVVLATALIGAAVMVVVGLPALRVPGLTLVVTTLGFAVISQDWMFNQSWLASSQSFGLTFHPLALGRGLGTPSSQVAIYFVAVAALALALGAGRALRRSTPGRLSIAVRDNERAAAAFGVTPATVKLVMLALSGALTAVAGVLWADSWQLVSASQFSANVSLTVLALPVIGGLGSLGGAVAAAVMLYGTTFLVGPLVTPVFGSVGQNLGFQLFLAGGSVVVTLLSYPTGLAGLYGDLWQRYINRRASMLAPLHPDEPATATPSRAEANASVFVPSLQTEAEPHGMTSDPRASVVTAGGGPPDDPPLAITGVRAHFGGVAALAGAEIVVGRGEIVGLIGPNGAGKTTLMNVISGVTSADAGSVRLFGNEVIDLPTDLRAAYGLARSFQDAALFPGLTVQETVQVALAYGHKVGTLSALLGAPWVRANERWSRERAAEIVDRFGLRPWRDSLTSDLSTGTRRICDLAAQVAAAPSLLLLDEPTAGVAQRDAEAFEPMLREIRRELDCSILIVEHDMPLLMSLCDRIYAMDSGRVIAEGTPPEIRSNPAVVASYLGTSETAISRSGDSRSSAHAPAPFPIPARLTT